MDSSSEEPESVRQPEASAHFGRKLLDERKMIAIERVPDVEKVERDDVRGVLLREQVRTGKIKYGVTRCFRLR